MTSSVLQELAEPSGVIKARLDDAVVRERLSRGIYSNPSSAFRELYANELRACREAKRRGLGPRIVVTLDRKANTLSIQGVDSVGVTNEKFVNVLSVIGETDNQTGTEVGQFGVGHLAFRAISDSILFESLSLENGESISYVGNGDVYQRTPIDRPLSKTGTRVTVTIRDGVSIPDLVSRIKEICRCSDVDTYLSEVDSDGNNDSEPERLNSSPTLTEDRRLRIEAFHIEDEDFEFVASSWDLEKSDQTCDVLLLRLPINAPHLNRAFPFKHYVLNIKDERKYPPTVDRERLTEQAQRDILAKVVTKLKEELPLMLDIKTLDDFRTSSRRDFYASGKFSVLRELYTPSEETQDIAGLSRLEVVQCHLDMDSRAKTRLSWLIQSSKNLFVSERVSKELLYALKTEYEDAVLFKLESGPSKERQLHLCRKYGMRFDAESEYQRIKNGLAKGWRENIPRGTRSAGDGLPATITTHQTGVSEFEQRGSTYHRLKRSVTNHDTRVGVERVIFIEELARYLPILNQVDSRYSMAKDLRGAPEGQRLEAFIERLKEKTMVTSEGELSFESLLSRKERVEVLVYDDPSLSSTYRPDGCIFITADEDTAFEVALWSTYHDRPFKVNYIVDEQEFREVTGVDRWKYFRAFYHEEGTASREESHEPAEIAVANCAFHVASAVRDRGLANLYLRATEGIRDPEAARSRREFVLRIWRNSSGCKGISKQ